MTSPEEQVSLQSTDLGEGVTLEWAMLPGGKARLAATYGDEILEDADYPKSIFGEPTIRGQFRNSVERSLKKFDSVDTAEVRESLEGWFAEMNRKLQEAETELLPANIQALHRGTESVEIYAGETTTVHVTLTYKGKSADLEFTADELTGGAGPLISRMANHFYEFDFECGDEDWNVLVSKWQDQAEERNVVQETSKDSVADRVLELVATNLIPVTDREKMGNDPASSWYDATNATGLSAEGLDPEGAIVWVQGSFLWDQIETAGKSIEYRGELVKHLLHRGDLINNSRRRTWAWESRTRVYPFAPEAVGVTGEELSEGEEAAHSEVSV